MSPLFSRRADLAEALRGSSRAVTLSAGALRWQKAMVVAQTALSIVVVSAATLIGLTFRNLANVPDGFASHDRAVARITLADPPYTTHASRVRFAAAFLAGLERQPELKSFGFTNTFPVGDAPWGGRSGEPRPAPGRSAWVCLPAEDVMRRRSPMPTAPVSGTALLGALLLASPALAQVEASPRDRWQRVDAIVAALDLQPGDRVADVGAGSGFLSFRLSPVVGTGGRVIAVDIDGRSLARLWEAAQEANLVNIDTLQSEPDDPMLPPASVDAVVIVNAYHEMTEYVAMLAGIRRALRPNGRLVIVDNPPGDSTASRRAQTGRHDIAIGLVARDLEGNGYRVIERIPDFIQRESAGRRRAQWMLVAVAVP